MIILYYHIMLFAGPWAQGVLDPLASVPPNPPSSKQWTPDEWTHCLQVAPSAHQMSGPTPPGPFGVAPRRPQEVSRHDPNHLWMQTKRFSKNACFPE